MLTRRERYTLQMFRRIHRDSPDTGPRLAEVDVHQPEDVVGLVLVDRRRHRRSAFRAVAADRRLARLRMPVASL